jgi:hypothetical protein
MENKQEQGDLLKREGEFDVVITSLRWEEMPEKNGDKLRMALALRCYTEENEEHPQGEYVDYYLYFTGQIVTSGRNKGKPLYEVSMKQCLDLGMTAPFDVKKVNELGGQPAVLVMKEETYEGNTRVRPKFLNARRYEAISNDHAANIWDKLTGGKAPTVEPKASQPANVATSMEDDLPFG